MTTINVSAPDPGDIDCSSLVDGDEIVFASGVYTGKVNLVDCQLASGYVTVRTDGGQVIFSRTSGVQQLEIKSTTGVSSGLHFDGTYDNSTYRYPFVVNGTLKVSGVNRLKLDYVKFDGYPGQNNVGLLVKQDAADKYTSLDDITVTNCVFRDCSEAIYIGDTGSGLAKDEYLVDNVVIANCEAYDCYDGFQLSRCRSNGDIRTSILSGITPEGANSSKYTGAVVLNRCDHVKIRKLDIRNVDGNGIVVNGSESFVGGTTLLTEIRQILLYNIAYGAAEGKDKAISVYSNMQSGHDVQIERCTIHTVTGGPGPGGIEGTGISISHATGDVTSCIILNCGVQALDVDAGIGQSGVLDNIPDTEFVDAGSGDFRLTNDSVYITGAPDNANWYYGSEGWVSDLRVSNSVGQSALMEGFITVSRIDWRGVERKSWEN